jgi:hypothetical protein
VLMRACSSWHGVRGRPRRVRGAVGPPPSSPAASAPSAGLRRREQSR